MLNQVEFSDCIPEMYAGKRLDWVLAHLYDDYSRSQWQAWIKSGCVTLAGELVSRPRHVLKGGESLSVSASYEVMTDFEPEAMSLDIVFEDEAIMVVNKPVGLIVHPGAGVYTGTLLNGLLAHDPLLKHCARAGIVHRLDKDTTGLMVVAKTPEAQTDLVRQLQARTVSRRYHALACGLMVGVRDIDAPIGRHPKHRTKMAVVEVGGKPAQTKVTVLKAFDRLTYIEAKLATGRTHQIRVHLAHIGHPLLGDPVYGKTMPFDFERQALHARYLGFIHPVTQKLVEFEAPLPEDFAQLLESLS